MFKLYPHQSHTIDRCADLFGRQVPRILVVAPTGSGKGTIAVEMLVRAHAKRVQSLLVSHRSELALDQIARLAARGVTDVDLITGGTKRTNPRALIHVGTVESVRRANLSDIQLLQIDEAHRSLAPGYVQLCEQLHPKWMVGFTGTPVRLDQQPLADAYDEMVIAAQPPELIAAGLLAPVRVYSVPPELLPDLEGVHSRGGDYCIEEVSQRVNTTVMVGEVVSHWQRRAGGRTTMVLCCDLEHAAQVNRAFLAAGVASEVVSGKATMAERQALMERVRSGETTVVVQCQLWIEGVDLPQIKCVVLLRPTKSVTIYLQAVGRALRPWNDVEAIVLDHVGCYAKFGLPDEVRQWKLKPETQQEIERNGSPEKRARMCPGQEGLCLTVVQAGTPVCPVCGHVFARLERLIETVDAELVEVSTAFHDPVREAAQRRAIAWQRFCAQATRDYNSEKWARMQFHDQFKEWPSPAKYKFPEYPQRKLDDVRRLEKYDALRKRAFATKQQDPGRWAEERYAMVFGERYEQTRARLRAAKDAAKPQRELPAAAPAEAPRDAAEDMAF